MWPDNQPMVRISKVSLAFVLLSYGASCVTATVRQSEANAPGTSVFLPPSQGDQGSPPSSDPPPNAPSSPLNLDFPQLSNVNNPNDPTKSPDPTTSVNAMPGTDIITFTFPDPVGTQAVPVPQGNSLAPNLPFADPSTSPSPSVSPSPSISPSPSVTPSTSPSVSPSPSTSVSPESSKSPTQTPSHSPSATRTPTPSPSQAVSFSSSPSPVPECTTDLDCLNLSTAGAGGCGVCDAATSTCKLQTCASKCCNYYADGTATRCDSFCDQVALCTAPQKVVPDSDFITWCTGSYYKNFCILDNDQFGRPDCEYTTGSGVGNWCDHPATQGVIGSKCKTCTRDVHCASGAGSGSGNCGVCSGNSCTTAACGDNCCEYDFGISSHSCRSSCRDENFCVSPQFDGSPGSVCTANDPGVSECISELSSRTRSVCPWAESNWCDIRSVVGLLTCI